MEFAQFLQMRAFQALDLFWFSANISVIFKATKMIFGVLEFSEYGLQNIV